MLKIKPVLVVFALLFLSPYIKAELQESKENYFSIAFEEKLAISTEQLNAQILKIEEWWHPGHTYSGKSENLFVDLKKRHCFCERLGNQGTVRHLDLVNYQPNKLIRFRGGLGPLQALPVNGVLDFTISAIDTKHSLLKVTYKVSSNSPQLKAWPSAVEQVLSEQIKRLVAKVNQ